MCYSAVHRQIDDDFGIRVKLAGFIWFQRLLVLSPLFIMGIGSLSAQITYTASFTDLLAEAGIEYAKPAESWFHVVLPQEDGYLNYDLVLENDNRSLEIRYIVHEKGSSPEVPPSVEVAGLIASIATNDPESEIKIQVPSEEFLRSNFNATLGIAARFVPKYDFSERTFGTLLRLYGESGAFIDVILLFDDVLYEPLDLYRSIWFKE